MLKYLILLFACCAVEFVSGQDYMIVFLNKRPDAEQITKEESEVIMKGHMANIQKLASDKKLLAAGPFDGGGGIFILSTASQKAANEWLSVDPGVQAKRWNIELYSYKPAIGSICAVSEPYEMVSYTFVRFDAIVHKFNASTYPQILKKHQDFMKQVNTTGNVITEAVFGDNDGSVLVMKGEVQREVFEADPGVQEGLLELTLKKLYIAKGSFCEK
jgi:uncharacterized protein YciI